MLRIIMLFTLLANVYGCAMFFPYDQDPKCPSGENFGRCVNSMDAYDSIATGATHRGNNKNKEGEGDENKEDTEAKPYQAPDSGYQAYVDANYRQSARMLDAPVTPLLKDSEVLEILVMPRSSDDRKVLFGQRYVHVIIETPSFILGDYLKVKKVPLTSHF